MKPWACATFCKLARLGGDGGELAGVGGVTGAATAAAWRGRGRWWGGDGDSGGENRRGAAGARA
ncbi:MAG: hypothetical protein OXU98_05830, partial [Gammaproteobacteria bacterium]|nr:hypothetical protein [Gammaproteobacteria bacterium]